MQIVGQGTVFSSRPKTDAASSCFPGICVLDSGRWLANFRLAPVKSGRTSRACLSWSDDQGHTWSEPVPVGDPLAVDGRAGVWRTLGCTPMGGERVIASLCWEDVSNPFQTMFNPQTDGCVDANLFLTISVDGGKHFAEPKRIHCGRYDDRAIYFSGPILVLPDDRWLAQFEVYKQWDDPKPIDHIAATTASVDEGKTWSEPVIVHSDPEGKLIAWDQRPVVMPDGSIFDVFWSYNRSTSQYLNIHAKSSTDGGQSWSDPWDTGVPGQPARPVPLEDGRIFMTQVDRTGEPIIMARLSADGGKSFPEQTNITIHQRTSGHRLQTRSHEEAWEEMFAFRLGLPDAVLLPGGDVLVLYYTGDDPDHTDVEWVRIKP